MRFSVSFKMVMAVVLLLALQGCASNGRENESLTSSANDVNDYSINNEAAIGDDPSVAARVDPYERYNRAMFNFNMKLDKWLLRPVAVGYQKVTPEPVQAGVGNFFSNLKEVKNVINDILQWKWKQAGNDTGRLVINSTVGVLGLFDVATRAGLPESDGEDFGQTFVAWGIPQGPYIVLPFLGPHTVTSGVGLPLEWYTNPLSYLDSKTTMYTLKAADIIHTRATLLEAEELMSGDTYIFIRDAYLQRRDYLINDGAVEDDFGVDNADQEYDF